jgi:hypothetical protein
MCEYLHGGRVVSFPVPMGSAKMKLGDGLRG